MMTEVIEQPEKAPYPMLVMLLLISMSPEQQALLGVLLSIQPVVRLEEGEPVGMGDGIVVGLKVILGIDVVEAIVGEVGLGVGAAVGTEHVNCNVSALLASIER